MTPPSRCKCSAEQCYFIELNARTQIISGGNEACGEGSGVFSILSILMRLGGNSERATGITRIFPLPCYQFSFA